MAPAPSPWELGAFLIELQGKIRACCRAREVEHAETEGTIHFSLTSGLFGHRIDLEKLLLRSWRNMSVVLME